MHRHTHEYILEFNSYFYFTNVNLLQNRSILSYDLVGHIGVDETSVDAFFSSIIWINVIRLSELMLANNEWNQILCFYTIVHIYMKIIQADDVKEKSW